MESGDPMKQRCRLLKVTAALSLQIKPNLTSKFVTNVRHSDLLVTFLRNATNSADNFEKGTVIYVKVKFINAFMLSVNTDVLKLRYLVILNERNIFV